MYSEKYGYWRRKRKNDPAIEKLAEKYSPRQEDGRQREIDRGFSALCMMELTVEHMTGKQAVELMREKL